jgi:hypothetical protein
MKDLLESVQTPSLKSPFDKYLPAVLNNITEKKEASKSKTVISESIRTVTGDKTAVKQNVGEGDNLIDFKRLAGL